MLLERCEPGTTLLEVDDDAAGDVVAGLLPRLWKKPPIELSPALRRCRRVGSTSCRLWEDAGRPFERQLLDTAVGLLRELEPDAGSARARERGPPRRQRPAQHTRAVARDRSEAARGRARVHSRRDGPRPEGRGAGRSAPARPGCAAASTASRPISSSIASASAAGRSRTRSRGASSPPAISPTHAAIARLLLEA